MLQKQDCNKRKGEKGDYGQIRAKVAQEGKMREKERN